MTALVDQIAAARADRTPLRIVGGGTWLDAGRPLGPSRHIDTRATAGIVEYVPGDLVITVGAGTTLREIAEVTREHNQWLALDPAGSDLGTIGATVATASSGSLSLSAGRVRDLVLGVTLLTGDAKVMIAGGRVVKNVAGFDLVRLQTGAFGTLGVITEVSIRLHALPEVDETVAIQLSSQHNVAQLGLSALSFQAMEMINGAAARELDISLALDETNAASDVRSSTGSGHETERTGWLLLARIAGNRDRVAAQRGLLGKVGRVHDLHTDVWDRLRLLDSDCAAVVRAGDAPSRIEQTISRVQHALASSNARSARLCATPHSGTVRVMLPASEYDAHSIRNLIFAPVDRGESSMICERLPDSCWEDVAPINTDTISRRIRDAFDPHRLLNRGIFGNEHNIRQPAGPLTQSS